MAAQARPVVFLHLGAARCSAALERAFSLRITSFTVSAIRCGLVLHLAGVLLTASLVAEEPDPTWSELFAELKIGLDAARPKMDTFEESEGRAEVKESMRVQNDLRDLYDKYEKLKRRLDEATDQERVEFEEIQALVEGAEERIVETQRFAVPEERRDDPLLTTMLRSFDLYGSLRLRAFTGVEGETELDENTSRIGIRGGDDIGEAWEFFGRGEWGINVLTGTTRLFAGGDPGAKEGEENRALPLRLLFVGLDGPQGRVSFGKQWAVFYDVGVFTDQLPYFGGTAQGTYAANTDGGVSGTGRADMALQYRFSYEPVKFGVQAQIRNDTDNNRTFADTYGASAIYQSKFGLSLGVAFNRVEDGVPDPKEGQAKLGDQAAIVGARWSNDDYYFAATYASFENHEIDDQDRFFSGEGFELYAETALSGRLGGAATWNYQRPDDDHPGDYRLNFLTAGLGYTLGEHWKFYALYRFDKSTLSDGTDRNDDSLGVSVFYNFQGVRFGRK